MGRRNRKKLKGRAERGTFAQIPHAVLDSAAWLSLGGSAVKLMCDLVRQYNGYNNGDLCVAWTTMSARGWKSRDTLTRALAELLGSGLIEKTRQGGLNRCSLYALTWHAIDDRKGKLDVRPTLKASALWKRGPLIKQNASTDSVSGQPGNRDNLAQSLADPTRNPC